MILYNMDCKSRYAAQTLTETRAIKASANLQKLCHVLLHHRSGIDDFGHNVLMLMLTSRC